MNIKFSIGYNFSSGFLKLLEKYQKHVEACYFPPPARLLGSGRYIIIEPKNYEREIVTIIRKCNKLKISSQLLINPSCEGSSGGTQKFFDKLLTYIKKLKSFGLKSIVVTNPIFMSIVKKHIGGIIVESSVNCYLKTVEHALYLKELGADVLTIDRDINRNIELIKLIRKKTGLPLRLMLNEGCLTNCPYRNMHYNYASHRIKYLIGDGFCSKIYNMNPMKIFRIPFVPPEHLDVYAAVVDHYKLTTRVFTTSKIESVLQAYIQRSWNGNLLDILDCPGLSCFEYVDYGILKKNHFFKKMLHCNLECEKCNFCEVLFKKAVFLRRDSKKEKNYEEEQKAIKAYRKLLTNACDTKGKTFALKKISRCYLKLDNYKKALEYINKTLKMDDKEGYKLLAYYYEKLGNPKEALRKLRVAKRFDPSDEEVDLAIIRCNRDLGRISICYKRIKSLKENAKNLR
jgi:collagenase-like PrtC family protease